MRPAGAVNAREPPAAADVNRDPTIDLTDLSLVRALLGWCSRDACYKPDADINS